jgi:hypothetical protein
MDTPVVFLIFNRPHSTERVFAEIAKARPSKLLIVADGPRRDRPGDAEKCVAARSVVDRVDWECEVLRNYSDVNLGCGDRVSSGLVWAFEHVEEAIILEDDTVPHPTFFRFSAELLKRYRDDERVMHISGNSYQLGRKPDSHSYYFSRYDHIWGWATWRRAFEHYDYTMEMWPKLRETPWLYDILGDKEAAEWWRDYFDGAIKGDRTLYDAWDCQWLFTIWTQNGLSITPCVNLVSNIGFGEEASHTRTTEHPLSSLTIDEMIFPLQHPSYMIRDVEADRLAFEQACRPHGDAGREGRRVRSLRKLYAILPHKVRRLLSPPIRRLRAFRRSLGRALRTITGIPRVAKILLFKLFCRSDYKRWTNSHSLETWWDSRTEKMAGLIPGGTRVIEFGAGHRQLEKFLDPSCSYVPSDLVDRGPGTIICDLNQRPLPDLRHLGADVAFFAGVLEYLRDVGSVVEWLSEQVSYCVASYACVSPTKSTVQRFRGRLSRLYFGYMNDYTEEELLELFKRYGFILTAQDKWTSQGVYLFLNQRTIPSLNVH